MFSSKNKKNKKTEGQHPTLCCPQLAAKKSTEFGQNKNNCKFVTV